MKFFLNKACLFAVQCIVLLAPVAQAASVSKAMGYMAPPAENPSYDCASFAGHWKGQCQDQDGKITVDEITIEQSDCDVVVINRFPLNIGGESNIGGSFVSGTSNVSLYSDWDAAKKKLEIRSQWRLRAFNQLTFLTDLSKEHYYLDKDQLKRDEAGKKNLEAGGSGSVESYSQLCSYKKM